MCVASLFFIVLSALKRTKITVEKDNPLVIINKNKRKKRKKNNLRDSWNDDGNENDDVEILYFEFIPKELGSFFLLVSLKIHVKLTVSFTLCNFVNSLFI